MVMIRALAVKREDNSWRPMVEGGFMVDTI
jgi:hypothetical protein